MTISPGTRLGPYEITTALGAGGMGEVYRASDTRLGRTVAIKILPQHLSADPQSRQRFEREAQTISQLSHPHICTLHDVGHENGIDFLVMEFLEGETLAQKLSKGPLTSGQSLQFGIQIAGALDKAHRQGIVHRDLKPGNIMLTKGGTKLLDFGLAKFQASGSQQVLSSLSALVTEGQKNLTTEGSIVGTLQYMSPEQLEGKEVDSRTDIFAFGTILYEMVTGKKAFAGSSQASLIAAILEKDPQPMSQLQPMTPPALERVVKTCLAKDPEDRWQNAHDLMKELRWLMEQDTEAAIAVPVRPNVRNRERLLWSILVFGLALALVAVFMIMHRPVDHPRPMSFSINLTDKYSLRAAAISPDGSRVVFAARDTSGKDQLWIRDMNSADLRPLIGTEHSTHPFWSPDSRFIGFFADGKLKKIDVSGGPPQILCNAPIGRGGTWNRENTILFCPNTSTGLYRVSASGGIPSVVTELEPGEVTHRWPVFLPDGRHYLYFVPRPTPQNGEIKGDLFLFAGSLDSKERKQLVRAESNMAYVSPGFLLYLREGNLLAQPFDEKEIKLSGEPFVVAENIQLFADIWSALFTASENGVLLYQTRSSSSLPQLSWFDRSGKEMGTLGPPGDQKNPRISPDGKRVALDMVDLKTTNNDLWIYETTGGIPRRFTSNPHFEAGPAWSPDGNRMAFTRMFDDASELRIKTSDGEGSEKAFTKISGEIVPTDWSPDNRYILCRVNAPGISNFELWLQPMWDDQKPVPLIKTNFSVSDGQFSPDGRWIAYVSNETGRWEVYVADFPAAGVNWKVSGSGGTNPRWRRDGKELYYMALDGKLMVVQVTTGPTFQANIARPLFQTYTREQISSTDLYSYDVSPDGERFLINTQAGEKSSVSVTVLLNWIADREK